MTTAIEPARRSRRPVLVVILAVGLLGSVPAADAQTPAKAPRIGWLSNATRTPEVAHLLDAFVQGLRELGYAEGQNIRIDYRFADGKSERLPGLAAELVTLRVDVIVTPNPAATQAAKRATPTIPIVMLNATDPVGSGLVDSLARPGGNITGLSAVAGPEIVGKHLELLKELMPKLSRVAVLRNPTNPDAARVLREVEQAAGALRVQLRVLDVKAPDELDGAFAAMTRERVDALLLLGDTTLFINRGRIATLAIRNRLPTVTGSREMAAAGFLVTYGQDQIHEFRRAAVYVDRILKGASPTDLPVEQPTNFVLVVNLKTARALGLTIPQAVLVRADEVIR